MPGKMKAKKMVKASATPKKAMGLYKKGMYKKGKKKK